MVTRSNTPEQRDYPVDRRRLEKRVRYALREGGIDIPSALLVHEMVEMAAAEAAEVRRMAGEIVGVLADRGDIVQGEALERLAFIVEFAYRDEHGEIKVHFGD